ncbi:hypothetical protein [Haliscomenobacter hydrossis]|uniref:Uncharacterized protein n=1 Tax=Haliscomenobacter hydrossis (strain ATCC 27775 / DSM 1100 / LMG 10767 / O) TaxID=760192 RepID=F4L4B4_HALH1|nr:hypothetical protein [Haliscomenobacter hydrossis]AEE51783.1 hypothetical protein Halhy_3935 [Haliscomenobacter hydrossis DSM 1100]
MRRLMSCGGSSYQDVEAATLPEVRRLMAEKYLETMKEHLPKKKIPGFDWERFVLDVERVFEEEDVLEGMNFGIDC